MSDGDGLTPANSLPGGEFLDCVVIGAGPAGLTAGLYLRRFHRSVRVIDAGHSRATYIDQSNNCAGFPQGITGIQLLERMNRHLGRFGGHVVHDTVLNIDRVADGSFMVQLQHERLQCRSVILCTGVKDRPVPLPGAHEVAAANLLRACPVCDGYEFTGKCVGVIGNSSHGVREAKFLRGFSHDVSFIKVEGDMDEPVLDKEVDAARLRLVPGVAQHLALGGARDVFVTMNDGTGHGFDVLYAALGVDPQTQLATALGARVDDCGCLLADVHGATSVAHLYAAGDAVSSLHQISVAVGQAALAATAVHNRL